MPRIVALSPVMTPRGPFVRHGASQEVRNTLCYDGPMQAIAISASSAPSPERTIESIEDEITSLSATLQAATYRLLVLIEEMDRRGGWADPLGGGCRSCAHWLSWRVGLDLGAARQYVRVARALPALPRIAEAFSRGELSYSKVRALSRVADAGNEETLLGWARAGTAAHVESLVRKYRRANRLLENQQAEAREVSRGLVTYFDHDGMLVLEGRLTPEQGAVLREALDRARDALYARPDGSAEPRAVAAGAEKPDGAQLLADALSLVAERSLGAEEAEVGGGDRFQVVVHVDAEVLASPDADGRCELQDGPALAPDTARRLACDCSVSSMEHGTDGELVPGRKTRVLSAPLRRALMARDGTRCQFPGCCCRGRDAHHVKPWINGGPTVLQNLTSLCRRHHVLCHEGGYRIEALPDGRFRFMDPKGRELVQAPPLPVVTGDPVATLAARWMPPEVEITPSTGVPTWQGETFDYGWAIEDLQARAGIA